MTQTAATPTSARRSTTAAQLAAEAAGTMILVFSVAGAAIFGAEFDHGRGGLNVGFFGVAFALGVSVLVGSYAFGPVSGGHFNPAVTIGLAIAGRHPWRRVPGYLLAQIVGGVIGSSLLVLIAAGGPHQFLADARKSGFASTGWGPLSPGGFPLPSSFLIEVVTTCVFLWVIIAVTGERSNPATAPVAIGLTLLLVALIAIPVSNGSFNPARSIATAIYGGATALTQLWMSVVAPILGAAIGGISYAALFRRESQASKAA
ncbi:aquaporin [uncultured Leifsonia sp.]|uniref:aquaporin n=1 Tax=uncultured Leifsonia sp. TaxID=340359 RepID=UPI0028D7FE65|nr:aquaporin [uncultured Leifsonia sp.]